MRSRDILLKLVLPAAIFLLLVFFARTAFFASIQQGILFGVRPFLRGVSYAQHFTGGERLSEEEGLSLIQENQRLKAENVELGGLRTENQALKQSLAFKEATKLPLKGARVLFYGQESGKEFLLIDQGKADGIANGNLVIDQNNFFVGRVEDVSDHSARVAIASNSGEVFEGEVQPLGVRTLARGIGARTFTLELLPVTAAIEKGSYAAVLKVGGEIHPLLFGQIVTARADGSSAFQEVHAILLAYPELLREVSVITLR